MQTQREKEAASFNQFYARQGQSPTLAAIFREGTRMHEFPPEILPYSFVTRSDLAQIAALLALSPGNHLVDLACGNGSLGLWLARQTGARLTGIDFSSAAIESAVGRAAALGLTGQSRFLQGSLEQAPIETASADAVVSIDALWLAADQEASLREMARFLKPGGRLVFTSWEQHIPLPIVKQPTTDYRLWLEAAGFRVDAYCLLLHSEQVMRDLYARIRDSRAALLAEMGEAVEGLLGEAHFVPGLVDGINYISREHGPHVLVAATRI